MSNMIDIWTIETDTFGVHGGCLSRESLVVLAQKGLALAQDDDTFGTGTVDGAGMGDVDDLASRVISLLCERQSQTASGARQFILDFLLRAVLRENDFHAALVLAALRGHRLSLDAIIDTYIPLTAEELGDMWVRSDLDFARVTVAALRLQTLLGEASSEEMFMHRANPTELAALVIVPNGEQHFLGAHVVAAQLRRLGVAVSVSFCETDQVVLARVEMDAPDMILMSCARVEGLETIQRTVKKIKRAVVPAPVLAIGGALRGDADGIRKKADVDLVTNQAKDVVGFCAKRMKALPKD